MEAVTEDDVDYDEGPFLVINSHKNIRPHTDTSCYVIVWYMDEENSYYKLTLEECYKRLNKEFSRYK